MTSALTRPDAGGGFRGGGSTIGGQGGVIALDGWTNEQMQVRNPASLHLAFPEARRGRSGQRGIPADFNQKQKEQELEQTRKLRDFFEKAQRYAAAHANATAPYVQDPQMEAMRPYLSGNLPVVFAVTMAPAIRRAVDFATQFKLRAVIETGPEAAKVADLLAMRKIPVVYRLPMENSIDSSAAVHEYDPYDSLFAAPGLLARAGVRICFGSSSAAMAKNLPTQVGITRGFGLSEEAALRALTLDAARVLGVEDTLGSLERGKVANVIVTDGDPLEITTHLHALFIRGKAISLENKHTRLYEKYMQRLPATRSASGSRASTGRAFGGKS